MIPDPVAVLDAMIEDVVEKTKDVPFHLDRYDVSLGIGLRLKILKEVRAELIRVGLLERESAERELAPSIEAPPVEAPVEISSVEALQENAVVEWKIPTSDRRYHWREWAILLILGKTDASLPTALLAERISKTGWDVFDHAYTNTRAACYRSCLRLEAEGKVVRKRLPSENFWSLTDKGRFLVNEFLVNNPHITPEKSRERFGGVNPEPERCAAICRTGPGHQSRFQCELHGAHPGDPHMTIEPGYLIEWQEDDECMTNVD